MSGGQLGVAGEGSEDSGSCMRRGQRGGHREERTATMMDIKKKKQHDCSTQFGPVESFYLHVSYIG